MAIKKLASSLYQIDFRDASGKRYRQSFETRRDADKALREQRNQVDKGAFIAPKSAPTFREAAEAWYKDKTLGIGCDKIPRPSTLWAWSIHVDKHLMPEFGDRHLDRIDVAAMEKFRDGLKDKKLAPQTINKILTTATAIFQKGDKKKPGLFNSARECARLGRSDGEIIEGQTKPRESGPVKESDVLSLAEVRRLLTVCGEDLYGNLVALAIFTGCRHDELLALRWGSVDLVAGTVWIRESLSWARLKGAEYTERWRFYPPKTEAGNRKLMIPPEIVSRLKKWKLKSPKGRLDLVFSGPDGEPIQRHHTLRCGLHPLLRRAGLCQVDMHSLRHSFATIRIMSGSPVNEVARDLGHSDSTTTLRIYTHWFEGVRTKAPDRMAELLLSPETEVVDLGHFVDTLGVESGHPAMIGAVSV